MDVGRSISYVFQDPQWLKKVLIGGVLSIIPIFGMLVVAGYWIRIARNVASGIELPLPDWNDFGGDFMRGLKAAVALLIWALPLIILFSCGFIPLAILNDSSDAAQSLAGLFWIGTFGVGGLLWLVVAFMSPLIIGRVALTDSIGAAFEVGAIIDDARNNVVPLLIIVAVSYALNFVASFGLILCFVGVIFTSFLAYVMVSHLYGQLWRRIEAAPGLNMGTGTITTDPHM